MSVNPDPSSRPAQSTADAGGLVCGFRLRAQQPAVPLAAPQLAASDGASEGPMWLHFNLADARGRNWIAACENLPAAARDFLLAADAHIRFERVGQGLVAVLGDVDHDLHSTGDGLGVLRLYADQRLVVTARRHPLKGIDQVRRDVSDGQPFASTIEIVVHVLYRVTDALGAAVAELSDIVDDSEERLFKDHWREHPRELARARRGLARLRRYIALQRNLDVPALLEDWCSEEEASRFRRGLDRWEAVVQDIELVQVRARLVQEEMARHLNEATNRNILFLSVITAMFLPITLIAGIFGMNVAGLPWTQDGRGFSLVMLLMAMTMGISLAVLRWRRLL